MAGFDDIIGQEHIIAHLKAAAAAGKVSHAYIIDGPALSGKRMIADTFAMALLCRENSDHFSSASPRGNASKDSDGILYGRVSRGGAESSYGGTEKGRFEPCMRCISCRQALAGSQPDIIHVVHEKPQTISVDDIRHQVNADVSIRPYSSPYKVYIIDEAEKMNVQAQNALLKTLEEPPSYAVIILLTKNAESFLPTIRSRCVTLKIKPVSDDVIKEYLMKNHAVPDYKAAVCASFSQGNVGRAIELAGSPQFGKLKDAAVRFIQEIPGTGSRNIDRVLAPVLEFKDSKEDFFDLLLMWYRDVLLYKASKGGGKIIFSEYADRIGKSAREISYEGLENIIQAVCTALSRVKANVSFDFALKALVLDIKENLK